MLVGRRAGLAPLAWLLLVRPAPRMPGGGLREGDNAFRRRSCWMHAIMPEMAAAVSLQAASGIFAPATDSWADERACGAERVNALRAGATLAPEKQRACKRAVCRLG